MKPYFQKLYSLINQNPLEYNNFNFILQTNNFTPHDQNVKQQ